MTTKKVVKFIKALFFTIGETYVLYRKNEKELNRLPSHLVDAYREIKNQSKAIEYSK